MDRPSKLRVPWRDRAAARGENRKKKIKGSMVKFYRTKKAQGKLILNFPLVHTARRTVICEEGERLACLFM